MITENERRREDSKQSRYHLQAPKDWDLCSGDSFDFPFLLLFFGFFFSLSLLSSCVERDLISFKTWRTVQKIDRSFSLHLPESILLSIYLSSCPSIDLSLSLHLNWEISFFLSLYIYTYLCTSFLSSFYVKEACLYYILLFREREMCSYRFSTWMQIHRSNSESFNLISSTASFSTVIGTKEDRRKNSLLVLLVFTDSKTSFFKRQTYTVLQERERESDTSRSRRQRVWKRKREDWEKDRFKDIEREWEKDVM